MLFETPEDTYNAYQHFLKKKDFKKAYRCLEKMLHQFPDDEELLEAIVGLCIHDWKRPEMARPWFIKLSGLRPYWLDFVVLSEMEIDDANFQKAKEYLAKARDAYKKEPVQKSKKEAGRIFSDIEERIRFMENFYTGFKVREKETSVQGAKPKIKEAAKKKLPLDASAGKPRNALKQAVPPKENTRMDIVPQANIPAPVTHIPTYHIPVKFEPFREEGLPLLTASSSLGESRMLIDYAYLTVQSDYDDLLCLNAIAGVEKYWYQTETVKRVLKHFRGRVLLADEVGLGKTIEAGMLIKEYVMRGMVKNVLILTPAPLVSQWKEEMQAKFGMEFATSDDPSLMKDPADFWSQRFIIASINTAKSGKNMSAVCEQFYDLVLVDEAHHLRNRTTLSWKLVNQIKKRFIFLLTATPVQNNLIELFNLITLLNPGQFKTEKEFKREYVKKGSFRESADREKLRGLLRDVMIRNTRSAIDLKLPKRFATTIRLEPTGAEREIYRLINEQLRNGGFKRQTANLLLRMAESSPFALRQSLLNMGLSNIKEITDAVEGLTDICKGSSLMELLRKNREGKKIIFTQFVKSMDYIMDLLVRHGVPHVAFRGDMSLKGKDAAIAMFKEDVPVLVSTESGGEGRNLQFCNAIINFDLPWNPMRIEQRIGRLHRIGQKNDVFIFNLAVKETIEDYILDILDSKINMFEMVIGEIEPILGHLGEDADFEDIITGIWMNSSDNEGVRAGFEQLGDNLVKAKGEYLKSKMLDNEIFGEDYEA